jgi:hypothetical protein
MTIKKIHFSSFQVSQMLVLCDEISEKAKTQNQGTSTIHLDYFKQIQSINSLITSVSGNYYDCDGKPAFALLLTDASKSLLVFDGYVCKGFAFGAPIGHLSRYFKLRW